MFKIDNEITEWSKQVFPDLTMEARNPMIKFSACLNVIEDWKEKLEEAE